MKKSQLLTVIFACIPGAGQMYYGYMQRGLSLICIFCFFLMAGFEISGVLVLPAAIVWMYSFFDTYDLIRYAAAGQPKEDKLLFVGDMDDFKKGIFPNGKIFGWLLIGLGILGVYQVLVNSWLGGLLSELYYDSTAVRILRRVLRDIPTLAVACLLIFVGMWLLGFRPAKRGSRQDASQDVISLRTEPVVTVQNPTSGQKEEANEPAAQAQMASAEPHDTQQESARQNDPEPEGKTESTPNMGLDA